MSRIHSTRRGHNNSMLRLEALEDRKLMAGNVMVNLNVAVNQWQLIGDALSNDVQIQNSSTGVGLEAVGRNGTMLNAAASPVQLGFIDNLFANLGMGDDRLGISGAGGDNDIGNIAAFMGDGNDRIEASTTFVRNHVSLSTGYGHDTIVANLQIGGNLNVNTGSGNDYVELSANTGLALLADSQIDPAYVFGGAIGGGSQVNINTGLGHDTVIFNAGVDGNLRINSGLGNDYVRVWSTQVADNALINMDGGTDDCDIEGSVFSGNTAIRMGAGADSVDIDYSTYIFSTGAFLFDGGLGGDVLDRDGNVFGVVINFETIA